MINKKYLNHILNKFEINKFYMSNPKISDNFYMVYGIILGLFFLKLGSPIILGIIWLAALK